MPVIHEISCSQDSPPKNTASIYKGLEQSAYDMNNVLVVNTEKEAFNEVYSRFTTKDTILLENDLPDAFLH